MNVFLAVVLASLVSRLGYQMARSPVLPAFASDLGAGPELLGVIVAASTITGVFFKLPAGTLYPLLHRLEADRLIKSRWDDSSGRRRKWYELTAKGTRRLHRDAQQWNRYVECLSQLLGPVLKQSPGQA